MTVCADDLVTNSAFVYGHQAMLAAVPSLLLASMHRLLDCCERGLHESRAAGLSN